MSVLQKVKSYTYFISETTQPQFVYVDCAFNKSILPKNLKIKLGTKNLISAILILKQILGLMV